jgi:hypothetical protein
MKTWTEDEIVAERMALRHLTAAEYHGEIISEAARLGLNQHPGFFSDEPATRAENIATAIVLVARRRYPERWNALEEADHAAMLKANNEDQ